MSKTPTTAPKKKGRPPKHPVNVASDEKTNCNPENIIPPSKISRITPTMTGDMSKYSVYAKCSQKQLESFLKLIEVINGITEEPCTFVFNSTGISLQRKDKNDNLTFDCRLFGDVMESYYCAEPIAIKLDQGTVLKFLKNFKGKTPFSIFIYTATLEFCEIGFETQNEETNVCRTYMMNYTPINYCEFISDMKDFSKDNFDIIVLLDSSFFMKECKDMKGLSQNFEIFCNNNNFEIKFSKDNMSYSGVQGLSNSMTYSKKFTDSANSLNKELSTIEVHDYIKCEGFSNIIKFYLSNDKETKTVIEFDVSPEFGVFQAYL